MSSPDTFLKSAKIPYETIRQITPYCLCITTKKGLPFWFGAMTLICEYQGQKIPILELPKKTRGLSLTTEDLISHEHIHFLRSAFNEPRFEELIAYRTSRSKWRKFLGPIFQSPWESYLCMTLFIPPLFFWPAMLLTISYVTLLFSRLAINQYLLKKTLQYLSAQFTNSEEILPLLTDSEIIKIARSQYFTLDKTSPRWQLITNLAIKFC